MVSTNKTHHPKVDHQLVGWLSTFGSYFHQDLFIIVAASFAVNISPLLGQHPNIDEAIDNEDWLAPHVQRPTRSSGNSGDIEPIFSWRLVRRLDPLDLFVSMNQTAQRIQRIRT